MEINFRTEIQTGDFKNIMEIISSTGFFYDYEIPVAVELAETAFTEGPEKSGYHFVFAEINNRVVAYSCYGPIACTIGSYDLYWIATHQEFRNLKIGKVLLNKTEGLVRAMNGRMLIAETSGTEKYIPTRKFYENNGYIAESIIRDFYQAGDDKYMFIKRL